MSCKSVATTMKIKMNRKTKKKCVLLSEVKQTEKLIHSEKRKNHFDDMTERKLKLLSIS